MAEKDFNKILQENKESRPKAGSFWDRHNQRFGRVNSPNQPGDWNKHVGSEQGPLAKVAEGYVPVTQYQPGTDAEQYQMEVAAEQPAKTAGSPQSGVPSPAQPESRVDAQQALSAPLSYNPRQPQQQGLDYNMRPQQQGLQLHIGQDDLPELRVRQHELEQAIEQAKANPQSQQQQSRLVPTGMGGYTREYNKSDLERLQAELDNVQAAIIRQDPDIRLRVESTRVSMLKDIDTQMGDIDRQLADLRQVQTYSPTGVPVTGGITEDEYRLQASRKQLEKARLQLTNSPLVKDGDVSRFLNGVKQLHPLDLLPFNSFANPFQISNFSDAISKAEQGRELSQADNIALRALATAQGANEWMSMTKANGITENIGASVVGSIPFMLEFIPFGGVTGSLEAGISGAMKAGVKAGGKKLLGFAGKSALQEAAFAPLHSMFYDTYLTNLTSQYDFGQDNNGGIKLTKTGNMGFWGNLYNSWVRAFGENYSERVGSIIDELHVGKVLAGSKAGKAAGLPLKRFNTMMAGTRMGQALGRWMASPGWQSFAKYPRALKDFNQKYLHLNNITTEILEERFNALTEPVLTGSFDWSDAYNRDRYLETIFSVALSCGAIKGFELAAGGAYKGAERALQLREVRQELTQISNQALRQAVALAGQQANIGDKLKWIGKFDWSQPVSPEDKMHVAGYFRAKTQSDLLGGMAVGIEADDIIRQWEIDQQLYTNSRGKVEIYETEDGRQYVGINSNEASREMFGIEDDLRYTIDPESNTFMVMPSDARMVEEVAPEAYAEQRYQQYAAQRAAELIMESMQESAAEGEAAGVDPDTQEEALIGIDRNNPFGTVVEYHAPDGTMLYGRIQGIGEIEGSYVITPVDFDGTAGWVDMPGAESMTISVDDINQAMPESDVEVDTDGVVADVQDPSEPQDETVSAEEQDVAGDASAGEPGKMTMPLDEDGNPKWHDVDPSYAAQYLANLYDVDNAREFVESAVKEAEKALKDAQKRKIKASPIKEFALYSQQVAQRSADIEQAQKEYDYWVAAAEALKAAEVVAGTDTVNNVSEDISVDDAQQAAQEPEQATEKTIGQGEDPDINNNQNEENNGEERMLPVGQENDTEDGDQPQGRVLNDEESRIEDNGKEQQPSTDNGGENQQDAGVSEGEVRNPERGAEVSLRETEATIRQVIDGFSAKLNLPGIKVYSSIDQVKDQQAVDQISRDEASGKMVVNAWFDPKTDKVYFYVPGYQGMTLDDVRRNATETILHEVIAHYGIKKLFGSSADNFFMGAYQSMTEEDRQKWADYCEYDYNAGLTDKQKRNVADEYIAHIAEKYDAQALSEYEKTFWDKIVEAFKQLLEAVGLSSQIGVKEIETAIYASYENMRKDKVQPASQEKTTKQKEAPEGEKGLLSESQIVNSGFGDETLIQYALDYIHGDQSLQAELAYIQIEDYVRTTSGLREGDSQDADTSQLDENGDASRRGESVPGGGETVRMGEEPVRTENSGVGDENAASPAGVEGDRGLQGEEAAVHGVSSRNNKSRGRSRSNRSGQQRNADGAAEGLPAGSVESGGVTESQAGSEDIAGLEDELSGLINDIGNLFRRKKTAVISLPRALYDMAPADKGNSAPLSSKRDFAKVVNVDTTNMTREQKLALAKLFFAMAKVGYANASKNTLYSFYDFRRAIIEKFQQPLMAALKIDLYRVNYLIEQAWNTKLKIGDQTLTLDEHVELLYDAETKSENDKSVDDKKAQQKKANDSKGIKAADRVDIKKQLPVLQPGQWDDVTFAERQFFDKSHNDYDHCFGKGAMVTNGTGTGKTFSGLGIVRRFVNAGKGRILIVGPASIQTDWVDTSALFGLDVKPLVNTKDAGKGIVITSYENFRQNSKIMEEEFDLVVFDEVQQALLNQQGLDTLAFGSMNQLTNRTEKDALERILLYKTKIGNAILACKDRQTQLIKAARKGKTDVDAAKKEVDKLSDEIAVLTRQLDKLRPRYSEQAKAAYNRTKVLMLSATPFNTIQNLKLGDGYVFNCPRSFKADGTEIDDANVRFSNFLSEWFGGEDREADELAFAEHMLHELETMTYRELDNGYDYSRDFPDVSGMVMAAKFNEVWDKYFRQPIVKRCCPYIEDYHWTAQLFETMKISALIRGGRLEQHLKAGRKLVIFHNRLHETETGSNWPSVGAPISTVIQTLYDNGSREAADMAALMEHNLQEMIQWENTLDYRPVNQQINDVYATASDRKKFAKEHAEWEKKVKEWEVKARAARISGDPEPARPKEPRLHASMVCEFNGEMDKKAKKQSKDEFNKDTSEKRIICVTTDAGGAGLSLHDTTGKFQRVLIQTALPKSPIGFIQVEGRINRFGQKSNAIFEYPLLGINWETFCFANYFNAKVGTTENLAHGLKGRGLMESIRQGFIENSGNIPVDGQGTGTKQLDKRGGAAKGIDKAIHDYQIAETKKLTKLDASISEPLGYLMAKLSGIINGDSILVPYGGRGSVSRYVDKKHSMTMLNTNMDTAGYMSLVSGGPNAKILTDNDFIGNYNVVNKADVIFLDGRVADVDGIYDDRVMIAKDDRYQFERAISYNSFGKDQVAYLLDSTAGHRYDEPVGAIASKEYWDKNIGKLDNLRIIARIQLQESSKWEAKGIKNPELLFVAAKPKGEFDASYITVDLKKEFKSAAEFANEAVAAIEAKAHQDLGRKASQIEVFEKSMRHLSEGGRIIAALPKGDVDKVDLASKGFVVRNKIQLPEGEVAGIHGKAELVIVDRITKEETRKGIPTIDNDFTSLTGKDLYVILDQMKAPERIIDKESIAMKKVKSLKSKFIETGLVTDMIINEAAGWVRFEYKTGLAGLTEAQFRDYQIEALYERHHYRGSKTGYLVKYNNFQRQEPDREWVRNFVKLNDLLGEDDADFMLKARIRNDAKPEYVKAVKDMMKLWKKLYIAMSGLTESQILRVAKGLKAEISVADINDLVTTDVLREKFEAANRGDEQRQELFDKVFELSVKSGLRVSSGKEDAYAAAAYYLYTHHINVNKAAWNSSEDVRRAGTLLHESIHSITSYAFDQSKWLLPKKLGEAVAKAEELYQEVQKGKAEHVSLLKASTYALENIHEFFAELANIEFREAMKMRPLWIVKGHISGIEVPGAGTISAWDYALQCLDGLIDNFSQESLDNIAIKKNMPIDSHTDYIPKDKLEIMGRLADNDIVSSSDGEVQFSRRTVLGSYDKTGNYVSMTDDEVKAKKSEIISDIMKAGGYAEKKVKTWIDDMFSLATNITMDEARRRQLDYTADDRFEAIKKNSDYPQGTVDFNNLCPKRIPLTQVFQMIQKKNPDSVISAKEIEIIRKVLKSRGIDVNCVMCFVEDRRQLLDEVAKQFKEGIKTRFAKEASQSKEKAKQMAKVNKLIDEDIAESGEYTPTIFDLVTLDGAMEMEEKGHGKLFKAFQKYNNSRGQQSVRLFEGYAEYKGEIAKWDAKKVDKVNATGGLRIFSFSDFEAHHLIDIIQVVTDCARRGVKIQCYTKQPAFARLIASTGVKCNCSLIPKGDLGYHIEDGKVVLDYDNIEGIDTRNIDYQVAVANNPYVGNIVVGINDTQIRAAMDDPNIHFIIPFHSNLSLNLRNQKKIGAWVNYKNSQSERAYNDNNKLRKAKKGVNIYTDVLLAADAEGKPIKTEKQFVEKFLAVAKKRKLVPRFSQFLNTDKKGNFIYTPGYYKFLVDFKMFDEKGRILPQGNVIPAFNQDIVTRVIDDYVKENEEKGNVVDRDYTDVAKECVESINKSRSERAEDKGESFDEEDGQLRFRRVTDEKKLEELNSGKTVKVYRAMQIIDGKLYPPMAAYQDGKIKDEILLQVWEESEEHPEIADKNGYVKIVAGTYDDGKVREVIVRYNPYFHTSFSPLNDQFTAAQDRSNLVFVECEIPESELHSTYWAHMAKDPVGPIKWHSGPVSPILARYGRARVVLLSRWCKPLRVVPESEIADVAMKLFEGTMIDILPSNVLTPALRVELEKRGMQVIATDNDGKIIGDNTSWAKKYGVESGRYKEQNKAYAKIRKVEKAEEKAERLRKYNAEKEQHPDWELKFRREAVDGTTDKAPTYQQGESLRAHIEKVRAWNEAHKEYVKMIRRQEKEVVKAMTQLQALRLGLKDAKANAEETVAAVLNLVKTEFTRDVMNIANKAEFNSIISSIREATKKDDIKNAIDKLYDALLDPYIRLAEKQWKELTDIKGIGLNQSGVRVAKTIGESTRIIIAGYNAGMNLSDDVYETRVGELADIIADSETESEDRRRAIYEIAGMRMAKKYKEELSRIEDDIISNETSIKELKSKLETEKNSDVRKNFRIQIEVSKTMIRDLKQEKLELISTQNADIAELIATGRSDYSKYVEDQVKHRKEILHMANSDLQPIKDGKMQKSHDEIRPGNFENTVRFMVPFNTFITMIKKFSPGAFRGEGKMYDHFVRGIQAAEDKRWVNYERERNVLFAKSKELFGRDFTKVMQKTMDEKMDMDVVIFTPKGEREHYPLSVGTAMYLHQVYKQDDGKMKLESMGIDEVIITRIREELNRRNPAYIKYADWLQSDFYPSLQKRYNVTHRRMFGVPMANIKDYAPLVLDKTGQKLGGEMDVAGGAENKLSSTITGAIVERSKNKRMIDIVNTNAMDIAMNHMKDMEHWAAYAEIIRDMNYLLNSQTFKRKVNSLPMGKGNFANFVDVAKIALGSYRAKDQGSNWFNVIMKGLAMSKVALRPITALKQLLSLPVFLVYNDENFYRHFSYCTANPMGSIKWAMQNLPSLRKRFNERNIGNEKLDFSSERMGRILRKMVDFGSEKGMFMNVSVDVFTCSIGARAMYMSRKEHYEKMGVAPAAAENKAILDAEICFNETQQSSEGLYKSVQQVQRDWLNVTMSVFNNANFLYQRMMVEGVRQLSRLSDKELSARMKAKAFEQYQKAGMSDEKATKKAESDVTKDMIRSMFKFTMGAWGAVLVWNLYRPFATLLMGGDPEKAKKQAGEELLVSMLSGPARGINFGSDIENVVRSVAIKGFYTAQAGIVHPAIEDFTRVLNEALKKDPDWLVFADLVTRYGFSVFGADPYVAAKAMLPVMDAIADGDFSKEQVMLDISRLLSMPDSMQKDIILRRRKGETMDSYMRRYVEWKRFRKYGFSYLLVGRKDKNETLKVGKNGDLTARERKNLRAIFYGAKKE